MRIVSIDEDAITFDDGRAITHGHEPDCCEWNYADFKQLDDLGRNYDFETELKFEDVEDYGFRFGDSRRMFFIPCYSVQNGYYSQTVDIYFDGKCVLSAVGEWIDG